MPRSPSSTQAASRRAFDLARPARPSSPRRARASSARARACAPGASWRRRRRSAPPRVLDIEEEEARRAFGQRPRELGARSPSISGERHQQRQAEPERQHDRAASARRGGGCWRPPAAARSSAAAAGAAAIAMTAAATSRSSTKAPAVPHRRDDRDAPVVGEQDGEAAERQHRQRHHRPYSACAAARVRAPPGRGTAPRPGRHGRGRAARARRRAR